MTITSRTLRYGRYAATTAILLACAAYTWLLFISLSRFESTILCSQGQDALIPKHICQSYLFHRGLDKTEVAQLNRGIGVMWAVWAEDPSGRRAQLHFLIEQGVDINAKDERSGFAPLHAAVIANDRSRMDLLLEHGADPTVRDRQRGQTPLELAQSLRDGSDRSAIVSRLRQHTAALPALFISHKHVSTSN